MIFLLYLLIVIFGTAIGSFLGVIVDRLGSREPIWKGRSHCDHCRHILQPLDLIPIVSFFVLGAKCRYCHKKLSWFYPLIEFCTGFSYLAAAITVFSAAGYFTLQLPYLLLLLYYMILSGTLLVIFFADVRYGIIPFKAVIVALLTTIVWYLTVPLLSFSAYNIELLGLQFSFLSIIGSAVGAGGFFFLLFILTKGRGMGFGDVVYAFLMGFVLGFPRVCLGLYIAFVLGAVISLGLVALKKKHLKGGTIPFGPFLVFGTIVSLFYGNTLIHLFIRYFT